MVGRGIHKRCARIHKRRWVEANVHLLRALCARSLVPLYLSPLMPPNSTYSYTATANGTYLAPPALLRSLAHSAHSHRVGVRVEFPGNFTRLLAFTAVCPKLSHASARVGRRADAKTTPQMSNVWRWLK